MEFLVTMTTHVPDGTPQESVDDVRAREAAHSRELAAAGSLLRLWRPPLAPGEWRTLGLFAAADAGDLETVLASMPLRIWRTDEVTPLGPHGNDPPDHRQAPASPGTPEFFTIFTVVVPDGTADEAVDDAKGREAIAAREQAAQGHLIRLWRLPTGSALGLWAAKDDAEMREIVAALPLTEAGLMTTQITPLTPHPSDPAITG